MYLCWDNVKSGSNDFKFIENDGFFRSDVVKVFMLELDLEEIENDDNFFGDFIEYGFVLIDDVYN